MNKQRFHFLIEKYKKDSLTLSEYKELLEILREPGSEQNLDQLLTRYWMETNQSIISPQRLDSARHDASLTSESTLVGQEQTTPCPPKFRKSPERRRKQINDSLSAVVAKSSQRRRKPQPLPQYWWSIAATLALLIGLFFYLWGGTELLGQKEIVYKTGYGERLEIDLDDGSHVTLNANSELRWVDDWTQSRDRQAKLNGEAFFEVKKQYGMPFTVHTDDLAIEVLGTSFNVDTREEKTEVYLDEGKVNLKLLEDLDTEGELTEKEIIMKPGDQIRYSVREKKIEKSEGQDLITAAAWKENVLNFKDMQFSEVLELLRDIYGKSFECSDGELLLKPMYIGVPYSDWDAVRQALELSLNIEFEKIASHRYVVKKK